MNPLLRIGVLAAVTTSVVLAGAAQATLGVTIASSQTTRTGVHELPTSTPQNVAIASLTAGTTYRASLVSPTPTVTPAVRGWHGAQFVTHQHAKVRYETAWLSWRDYSGREVDIVSGPAMTTSPGATIAQPRSRIPDWTFDPYDPPGPVGRWTIAGRKALYFDATAPPHEAEWTLVGRNPPELRIDQDHSFRMAALSVRGKTVVVVIQAPAASFAQFLPTATRLITSLRFPNS